MSTEIINIAPVSTPAKNFKNKDLQDATQKISAIYSDALKYADTKNREIASILATVAAKKSYEQDGFKSVADYANQTFGIGKQSAYALASAGKVYNNPKAPEELKEFTPYNLAAISSVPAENVQKAVKEGKISKNSTQRELKDFVAQSQTAGTKTTNTEVVTMYTADVCGKYIPENLVEIMLEPHTRNDWDDFFKRYISDVTETPVDTVETVKLPMGKIVKTDKKATIPRCLYFNRNMSLIIEYREYKNKPKKKESKKVVDDMSVEELEELLKAKKAELSAPDHNDK